MRAIWSSCGVSSSNVVGCRLRAVSPLARSSRRARSLHGSASSCSKTASAPLSSSLASRREPSRRRCSPWLSRTRASRNGCSAKCVSAPRRTPGCPLAAQCPSASPPRSAAAAVLCLLQPPRAAVGLREVEVGRGQAARRRRVGSAAAASSCAIAASASPRPSAASPRMRRLCRPLRAVAPPSSRVGHRPRSASMSALPAMAAMRSRP